MLTIDQKHPDLNDKMTSPIKDQSSPPLSAYSSEFDVYGVRVEERVANIAAQPTSKPIADDGRAAASLAVKAPQSMAPAAGPNPVIAAARRSPSTARTRPELQAPSLYVPQTATQRQPPPPPRPPPTYTQVGTTLQGFSMFRPANAEHLKISSYQSTTTRPGVPSTYPYDKWKLTHDNEQPRYYHLPQEAVYDLYMAGFKYLEIIQILDLDEGDWTLRQRISKRRGWLQVNGQHDPLTSYSRRH